MSHFYISTPIYYVNAQPHLGHAYTTILADSLNRWNRLNGKETFFLTGTDEHGDKIVKAAEKNKQAPKEYTDTISGQFQDLWPRMQVACNRFIRTTDADHIACVQDFLQRVYDKGDIYFAEYGGHYCFGCERFYTEKELENGLCPDHQVAPEFIQEKNYFFRMQKYIEPLRQHIEANPDFIQPAHYRNAVLAMLREDLGDLCISRPKSRLTWGIELPFDADFVTYVWFDALLNYITGLGGPEGENFKRFWPVAHHLVAKDILKPHAVFWPTMLLSAGLPLYQELLVHGYWTVNETKMSKSLGNVVAPLSLAEKYGLDPFRYFLLREMNFGQDASFSEEALVGRLNADLANDLGNLFSRTLTMTHKFLDGKVPEVEGKDLAEDECAKTGQSACVRFGELFGQYQFGRALEELWSFVRYLNKYIDQNAPWTLHKTGKQDRLRVVLRLVLEGMRKVAVLLWPVIPDSSEKMLAQLGDEKGIFVDLQNDLRCWEMLPAGTVVARQSNLFPRCEFQAPAAAPVEEEQTELIEFTDFQRVQMRIGTVLQAKAHPKADRLYLLQVDLGEDKPRQIVAGLAEFWKLEELTGRQVVVVANLKPRKLRGEKSEGMVLAVKDKNGLALLAPNREVSCGASVS